MIVDVYNFGTKLSKVSRRLVIKEQSKIISETAFFNIDEINIYTTSCSISGAVIESCVKQGIPINLMKFNGSMIAKFSAVGMAGTVKTRRAQLLAYNTEKGLELIKIIGEAKIKNQISNLKYFSKNKERSEELEMILNAIKKQKIAFSKHTGKNIDEARKGLMAIEGRASNLYWQGVKMLISPKVNFDSREHRGAKDITNCMLNYGYAVLEKTVWNCLERAGLDIFAGFMHTDRPGRASLVYDCMEEYRQFIVDRAVIGIINQGYDLKADDGFLTEYAKQLLIARINERLDLTENYEGKKYPIKSIMQMQARHLATFFRGERDYKAFVGKW